MSAGFANRGESKIRVRNALKETQDPGQRKYEEAQRQEQCLHQSASILRDGKRRYCSVGKSKKNMLEIVAYTRGLEYGMTGVGIYHRRRQYRLQFMDLSVD